MNAPGRSILAPDALSLTNLHTFYGDSHVLHGVSFALRPGGVLALLGLNGAGKTTCISTIIGFLKPGKGEKKLFGEPIGGLSPERNSQLGIGLVPQGRRIFPSLSVKENLLVARQRERATDKPSTDTPSNNKPSSGKPSSGKPSNDKPWGIDRI